MRLARALLLGPVCAALFTGVLCADDLQTTLASGIKAEALRSDVQFLASDSLAGRDTPSQGLDAAADFLAQQFRGAGLEPAARDGYFQNIPGFKAKNVAAILRGSDPALRDTFVLLTAHYDHIGLAKTGADRIYNGANDDASGTASVLEIARALAALQPHPRRSILFILFCGEEKGLLGSRFYAAHPVKPLADTVAQINLEQMGRTDSTHEKRLRSANVTGFDYSGVTQILVQAGKRAGVRITKDRAASDPYFEQSDNAPLALAGIPAHTVSVAYEFPDYHGVGDEWQKLDYANMAQVDQAVGAAVLELASLSVKPQWNENYRLAKPYVDAAKKLHSKAP